MSIPLIINVPEEFAFTMSMNGNPKHPLRGGGRSGRGSKGQSRRAPGGVEDNQHQAMDLRKMTRSINLYHSQDIRQVHIIPSRISRKPSFVLSH